MMAATPELYATGIGFTEGPVALADGSIWVTSIGDGRLYRIRPDGSVDMTLDVGGGPNGLAVDADGVLYVAQNGGVWGAGPGQEPGIQRVNDGKVEYIVTGMAAPNDLCFGPDGRLYFTDPRAPADPADRDSALPGRLYACARDGTGIELLHEGPRFINGLAFSARGEALFLAETAFPHRILRAALNDGVLAEPEEFTVLDNGYPDGMAVADDGSLWVAATIDDSIHVFDEAGKLLSKVPCGAGSLPTNICFSISGPTSIYITTSGHRGVSRKACDTHGLKLYC